MAVSCRIVCKHCIIFMLIIFKIACYGETSLPVWSQWVTWIKPPEALHTQKHHSLQSINLHNWREMCSLAKLHLKKKSWLNLQLTLLKTKLQAAVRRLFSSIKKKRKEKALLQAVGCFLAIRMSENLGLFSNFYLLTKAQKFHFLTDKRCGVLQKPVNFFFFFNCWRRKTFAWFFMWIMFWHRYSEKSNVNRC